MISFIPFEVTSKLLFFIGAYYLIVIMLFWRNNISKFDTFNRKQPLLLFFIFIHLLFAFEGGDYFHYYEKVVNKDIEGIEDIYIYILNLIDYNYLLFRTIVWGGALWLFLLTATRFCLDRYKAAFLLYVMFFTIFDYARASFAMAIYFYGLSYICVPMKHHKILSYIVASFFILASVFFHRSMIFAVVITLMAVVPLNKKMLIVFLLLFVASIPLLNTLSDIIITMAFNNGGDIGTKISEYANQVVEMETSSIYEQIRRYIEYASFYITFFFVSLNIFDKKYITPQNHSMQMLYKVTLGIMLFSTTLLLLPFDSLILFYRFLYMSTIPLIILFYYARQNQLVSPFIYKSIILLCVLNVFFNYSKRLLGGNIN